MLQIDDPARPAGRPLFALGFRPFFLLGTLFAALAMAAWAAMYHLQVDWLPPGWAPLSWHAHEMLYGYAFAVAAGFLLTAVRNWTDVPTLNGMPLALLVALWLCARLLPFSGLPSALSLMAAADLLFFAALLVALYLPVARARQWKQLPILYKIGFLGIGNLLFYLGQLGVLDPVAAQWGIYLGLYLLVSLVMLMGRRVVPFFIERGVAGNPQVHNRRWLDLASLWLFLAFTVVEVFFEQVGVSAVLAAMLCALHGLRLWDWHHPGIWRVPLLWVLFLGYGFLVLGLGLHALSGPLALSPWPAVHAFAAGGIGLMTAGMMARVSLGHTGRNVFDPPRSLVAVFVLLALAAAVRVFAPLALPASLHAGAVGLAQACWIAAFGLLFLVYAPMLLRPRADGRPG